LYTYNYNQWAESAETWHRVWGDGKQISLKKFLNDFLGKIYI